MFARGILDGLPLSALAELRAGQREQAAKLLVEYAAGRR